MGIIAKALKKSKVDLTGQTAHDEVSEFKLGTLLDDVEPSEGMGSPAGPVNEQSTKRIFSEESLGEQEITSLAAETASVAGKPPQTQEALSVVSDEKDREAQQAIAAAPLQAEARQEPPRAEPVDVNRAVDPSLVSLLDPDCMEAELFRQLRTRILFPQDGPPPRTILITSALAEEGKSFVAANLAINMARNVDQHVLLVDCDLRKPSIHSKFGFNGFKGLSEYLSGGQDIPSMLIKTGVEKLTLLPSGAPPLNPSELVTSSKMAALIKELKDRYDDRYIIIDSPPPMMAPETSAIAKWVAGILLVVKYGTTPMEQVEELITHLDREKIIGAVINKFSPREFRRYSYKKYYRYGRYNAA